MGRYAPEIGRRLLWTVFVIIGITLLTFVLSHLIPADPARLAAGLEARDDQVEVVRQRMGLDQPLPAQYWRYVTSLIQGDLGKSARNFRPVTDDLRIYFPATFELVLTTIAVSAVAGTSMGVVSAINKGKLIDKLIQTVCLVGVAVPRFWLAVVIQLVFYAKLKWFPSVGRLSLGMDAPTHITGLYVLDGLLTFNWPAVADAAKHLALPTLTLFLGSYANVVRIARASLLDVLPADYVRTAKAKGLSRRIVLWKHAVRNAAIPIVTIVGLQAGWLFSGAVLVEVVFGWPGLGKYAIDSIAFLDFQPVMGVTLVVALAFLLINLIVDTLYLFLDPRVSYD